MICLDAMVPIKQLGEDSSGGQEKVFGTRYSLRLRNMLTQSENSTWKSLQSIVLSSIQKRWQVRKVQRP